MMYLEFSVYDGKPEQLSMVVCTDEYSVTTDDKGLRIYYDRAKSLWCGVSQGSWLNCHVINESGKVIRAYSSVGLTLDQ